MEEHEVRLFYNPTRVSALFLQNIYRTFGLDVPSEEELMRAFFTDSTTGRQSSATKFNTRDEDGILSLTKVVMSTSGIRIEITPSSYGDL